MKEYRSPTNMVWLIGRTQTNGKDDYANVHAMQDRFKLMPLSAWGKAYAPPENVSAVDVDTSIPPVEHVTRMAPESFLARFAALLKANPPADADAPVMKRLAKVGIVPGTSFDEKSLDPTIAAAIEQGVQTARGRFAAATKRPQAKAVNGWEIARNLGRYGNNYVFRTGVAILVLGANLPEDAIYPRARVDSEGKPFVGTNRYELHFAKEQLPPVEAFWSVTLYNSKQAFVDNPIGRYAIGDRDRLKFNSDGSLTLYIQHESPSADKMSNWLPAPKEEFNLIMRLYWPKKSALDGSWTPPGVQRIG
jgi:hypothetical protein